MSKETWAALAASVLLAACGTQTLDDKREAVFAPAFEAAMAQKDYCGALKILSARFEYATDYQNGTADVAPRMRQWESHRAELEKDCARQSWPEEEKGLVAKIHAGEIAIRRLDEARSVAAVVTASEPLVGSSMSYANIAPIQITNNSSFPIRGLNYALSEEANEYSVTYEIVSDELIKPGQTVVLNTEEMNGVFGADNEFWRTKQPIQKLGIYSLLVPDGEINVTEKARAGLVENLENAKNDYARRKKEILGV